MPAWPSRGVRALPSSDPRQRALDAWLAAAASGAGHPQACAAAARAAGPDPWQALAAATPIARARPAVAEDDLGLDAAMRRRGPDDPRAVVQVPAGAPYPALARGQRKALGAFDTPAPMARRVVRLALEAAEGPVDRGLDPACGTGTFLLAMCEAGVREIRGEDLDPAAVAVAAVVVPGATVVTTDGLAGGARTDLVVGNPPFVPPERQDKQLRAALRRRLPWLHGRFDLAVPFAWLCSERLRPGGGLGLVLPSSLLVQPYGRELRRRWLQRHRITHLGAPEPFPGARVSVVSLALRAEAGPATVPPHGVAVEDVLGLAGVPLCAWLLPGDAALLSAVRALTRPLGELFEVDTGVVVHGRGHRREDLVSDAPGEGRLPYADARDLRAGRRRWLDYQPDRMHRAKRPALFEGPKLLVPRVVADRPIEVFEDTTGLWVGHTVNVARPLDPSLELAPYAALLRAPLTRAVLRLERGERLDLYPRDLRSLPVPRAWQEDPSCTLREALSLEPAQWERLQQLGAPRLS